MPIWAVYTRPTTTQLASRAGLAALAYIALFGLLDLQLELHLETSHRVVVRLIVLSVALFGGLAALLQGMRRTQVAEVESLRRIEAAAEEARLQGALLTMRELAPWVAPNATRPTNGASSRSPAAARRELGRIGVLTAREREVALLIAQGRTSRHIAEALVITERTVDTHADRIRAKLGLHSRAEIVAWVLSKGSPATSAEPDG